MDEEIFQTLNQIDHLKTPEPGNMHSFFFLFLSKMLTYDRYGHLSYD